MHFGGKYPTICRQNTKVIQFYQEKMKQSRVQEGKIEKYVLESNCYPTQYGKHFTIRVLLNSSTMPAKDIYHNEVKNALIKDGWTITDDPYFIKYEDAELYADLAAEKPIAA
ncbi:MAG: element excision factor XisH family protein, partial [Nostoc sp.]